MTRWHAALELKTFCDADQVWNLNSKFAQSTQICFLSMFIFCWSLCFLSELLGVFSDKRPADSEVFPSLIRLLSSVSSIDVINKQIVDLTAVFIYLTVPVKMSTMSWVAPFCLWLIICQPITARQVSSGSHLCLAHVIMQPCHHGNNRFDLLFGKSSLTKWHQSKHTGLFWGVGLCHMMMMILWQGWTGNGTRGEEGEKGVW